MDPETYDLGGGWRFDRFPNGSAAIRNENSLYVTELTVEEVAKLRELICETEAA